MEPLRIDHVGIAVNSLDEMRPFYEALGLKSTGIEEVKEQQVRVEFYPCGDSELELLESTTEDGPIAKFIEKKGTGIQHIAIRVPDIKAAIAEMQEKGFRMIDNAPPLRSGRSKHSLHAPQGFCGRAAGAYRKKIKNYRYNIN